VTGNHDFWMRNFFQDHLNIEVNHGIYSFNYNSKSFCLFHGDGVLKEDIGYKILKLILQNPITIKMYQWIHPDIGIPIAKWASAMSRNHYVREPEKQEKDDNEYWDFAKEILKNSHDFMLMGHTHRPTCITNGNKTYINLGDWIGHFTYARYSQNELKLFRWLYSDTKGGNGQFKEIKPEHRDFK
jgi:UDP-2,3-diacylglucosamine hydrolase